MGATPEVRDIEPLPRWLSVRALVVLAVFIAALLAAWAVWFLAYERGEMQSAALREVELHARLLAEQVDRNFDAADVSLHAAAEAISAGANTHVDAVLAQAARGLPMLRSITQLDAEGRVLASSNAENRGATPQGRAVAGRLRVGGVLGGRDLADARQPTGTPLRHMFVPAQLGEGSASSPRLLASLNIDYFGNSFDLLLGGTRLHAALVQLDLRPLAASQDLMLDMGVPLNVSESLAHTLRGREHGFAVGRGPVLDADSVWAFRATREAPWLVVVAVPLAVMEEKWNELALSIGVALAVSWLLLGTLVMLARRSLRVYGEQRMARRMLQVQWQREQALNARLIDASSTPIYVKDTRGRVTQVNRAWRALTGLADLVLPAELSEQIDPQGADCPDDQLVTEGGALQFEARLDTALGVREMLVSKAAFRDGQDAVGGLVCSLTDISAYREMERRSREAAAAAQAANDAKTRFIANMSHELRTPLQSILGFSEIGRDRSGEVPRIQVLFERVHAAGKNMLVLVEQLLHLADPEMLRQRLHLQRQPIGPVLVALVADCSGSADGAARTIDLRPLPQPDPLVRVDAAELQRLLSKLVQNALQFSPPGSRVEIGCEVRPGGEVLVTVADRGPGVPEEELETIFQPFERGSRTDDQAGGAGLGLAIARSIAGMFGGRVWAANREGGGAVFNLDLPSAGASDESR